MTFFAFVYRPFVWNIIRKIGIVKRLACVVVSEYEIVVDDAHVATKAPPICAGIVSGDKKWCAHKAREGF